MGPTRTYSTPTFLTHRARINNHGAKINLRGLWPTPNSSYKGTFHTHRAKINIQKPRVPPPEPSPEAGTLINNYVTERLNTQEPRADTQSYFHNQNKQTETMCTSHRAGFPTQEPKIDTRREPCVPPNLLTFPPTELKPTSMSHAPPSRQPYSTILKPK
jgi:hypothetical protein